MRFNAVLWLLSVSLGATIGHINHNVKSGLVDQRILDKEVLLDNSELESEEVEGQHSIRNNDETSDHQGKKKESSATREIRLFPDHWRKLSGTLHLLEM